MTHLREAVNVDDLKQRDKLVRRFREIRADAVLQRDTLHHWNRLHPNEQQFDTSFEAKVIAWCDGEGPQPTTADIPTSAASSEPSQHPETPK